MYQKTKPDVILSDELPKQFADNLLNNTNYISLFYQRFTFKTAINTAVECVQNYKTVYDNMGTVDNKLPDPKIVADILYSFIQNLSKEL